MIQMIRQRYSTEALIRCTAVAAIFLLIGLTTRQALLMKPGVQPISAPMAKPTHDKPKIRYDALFGRYEGKDRPLQETGLNLKLMGVFATQDSTQGSAVISVSGQKPKLVAVGDSMPGGIKLIEVYPDRIVLEHAGEQSVLRLPKKSL
jgi:type II secretory pathway component PulC